jgi:hypothetical protein
MPRVAHMLNMGPEVFGSNRQLFAAFFLFSNYLKAPMSSDLLFLICFVTHLGNDKYGTAIGTVIGEEN